MDKRLLYLIVFGLTVLLAACGSEDKTKVTENDAPPTWEKTIGGDEFERANAVVSVPGGGYVIAGTIGLGQGTDVYLVKIDGNGETAWERSIGGSGLDEARSIVATADGGFLLAGSTNSAGYGLLDSYMLKVDASGNKSWDNAYGGSMDDRGVFAGAVSGGYLLAGTAAGPDAKATNLVLIHTLTTGSLRQRDVPSESDAAEAYAGAATVDGGAIIVGTDGSEGNPFPQVYLLRADNAGSVLWEKRFGGDRLIHPWAITPVGQGYVIVGDVSVDAFGDRDAYVAKLDGSGNVIWEQTFGSQHPDELHAVCPATDGGLIIAGWTQAAIIRGSDAWLVKTTADGVVAWERTFGGDSFDEAFGVSTTPEGGYLLVGRTASFGTGGGDFYVIKTDGEGKVEDDNGAL